VLTAACILAGAFVAGFVSGLAGFGTGLIALGIWLHVIAPPIAAALVVICSTVSQLQTLPAITHAMRPKLLLPFILPGLIGVPLGAALLGQLQPGLLRAALGLVLIGFSAFMLLVRPTRPITWGGRAADALVGFGGGILGGLSGLSGPLPIMWSALRGWPKQTRRAVIQGFSFSMLVATLLAYLLAGLLTLEVAGFAAMALPGTMLGAWLGARAYRRLSDRRFDQVVLGLLTLSGLVLLFSGR
jgi:uncharacterized membrane protein YfcA